MIIAVYVIVVVIVILLLVVFNVRSSRKRSASSLSEPEAAMETAGLDHETDVIDGADRDTTEAEAIEARQVESKPIESRTSPSAAREDTPVVAERPNSFAAQPARREGTATASDTRSFGEGSPPVREPFRRVAEDEAAPLPVRRSSSGKDTHFRGALRDMSSGDRDRAQVPSEPTRSREAPITDNDYRNALRKMKKEDPDRR